MQEEKDIIAAIIDGIQEKKGRKINVLDLAALGVSNAAKFVICEGNSTSQVSSIADSVRENVQKVEGRKPINVDGYRNSQWIVIDYGDVMVHVFIPEARQFYGLEELWSDAPSVSIPDIL